MMIQLLKHVFLNIILAFWVAKSLTVYWILTVIIAYAKCAIPTYDKILTDLAITPVTKLLFTTGSTYDYIALTSGGASTTALTNNVQQKVIAYNGATNTFASTQLYQVKYHESPEGYSWRSKDNSMFHKSNTSYYYFLVIWSVFLGENHFIKRYDSTTQLPSYQIDVYENLFWKPETLHESNRHSDYVILRNWKNGVRYWNLLTSVKTSTQGDEGFNYFDHIVGPKYGALFTDFLGTIFIRVFQEDTTPGTTSDIIKNLACPDCKSFLYMKALDLLLACNSRSTWKLVNYMTGDTPASFSTSATSDITFMYSIDMSGGSDNLAMLWFTSQWKTVLANANNTFEYGFSANTFSMAGNDYPSSVSASYDGLFIIANNGNQVQVFKQHFNWNSTCLTCLPYSSTLWYNCTSAYYLTPGNTWNGCHPSWVTWDGPLANNWLSCKVTEYLSNKTWYAWTTPCYSWTAAGVTFWTSWITPLYFSSGQWFVCDPNCLTCETLKSTVWLSWASGQYLSGGRWFPWNSICKEWNGGTASSWTSWNSPLTLVNSTCIQCHSSWNICSGTASNQCLTWAVGLLTLYAGSCFNCHSSCSTWTGTSSSDWLSCTDSTNYLYMNQCIDCHDSWLTWSGTASNQWISCNTYSHVFKDNTNEWISWYFLEDFKLENSVCIDGDMQVKFTGWSASLVPINFTDVDSEIFYKQFTVLISTETELDIGNEYNTILKAFNFSDEITSKSKISSKGWNITIDLNSNLLVNTSIQFSITTNHIGNNTVYEKNGLNYNLVKNSSTITLTRPLENKGNVSEKMLNSNEESSIKSAVVVLASVGLAGSACSLNLGGSFIKIFQIIEIFGKLYYIPLNYTDYLDLYLSQLNNMGDLAQLDADLIIEEQTGQDNRYFGKLTQYSEKRDLLRSNPAFVLAFIFLQIVKIVLGVFKDKNGNKWKIEKIAESFRSTSNFILMMSFVDFAFYASYGLIGGWSHQYWTLLFIVNKAMWIYLLSVWSYQMWKELEVMIHLDNWKDKQSIFYSDLIKEGVSTKDGSLNKLWVRALNPIFMFKMFIYQVVITSIQNFKDMWALFLLIVSLILAIHFFYVLIRYKPFENWLVTTQRISLEVTILVFFIYIWVTILNGIIHIASSTVLHVFDNCILAMIVLWIFMEILGVFNSVWGAWFRLLWKRKGRVDQTGKDLKVNTMGEKSIFGKILDLNQKKLRISKKSIIKKRQMPSAKFSIANNLKAHEWKHTNRLGNSISNWRGGDDNFNVFSNNASMSSYNNLNKYDSNYLDSRNRYAQKKNISNWEINYQSKEIKTGTRKKTIVGNNYEMSIDNNVGDDGTNSKHLQAWGEKIGARINSIQSFKSPSQNKILSVKKTEINNWDSDTNLNNNGFSNNVFWKPNTRNRKKKEMSLLIAFKMNGKNQEPSSRFNKHISFGVRKINQYKKNTIAGTNRSNITQNLEKSEEQSIWVNDPIGNDSMVSVPARYDEDRSDISSISNVNNKRPLLDPNHRRFTIGTKVNNLEYNPFNVESNNNDEIQKPSKHSNLESSIKAVSIKENSLTSFGSVHNNTNNIHSCQSLYKGALHGDLEVLPEFSESSASFGDDELTDKNSNQNIKTKNKRKDYQSSNLENSIDRKLNKVSINDFDRIPVISNNIIENKKRTIKKISTSVLRSQYAFKVESSRGFNNNLISEKQNSGKFEGLDSPYNLPFDKWISMNNLSQGSNQTPKTGINGMLKTNKSRNSININNRGIVKNNFNDVDKEIPEVNEKKESIGPSSDLFGKIAPGFEGGLMSGLIAETSNTNNEPYLLNPIRSFQNFEQKNPLIQIDQSSEIEDRKDIKNDKSPKIPSNPESKISKSLLNIPTDNQESGNLDIAGGRVDRSIGPRKSKGNMISGSQLTKFHQPSQDNKLNLPEENNRKDQPNKNDDNWKFNSNYSRQEINLNNQGEGNKYIANDKSNYSSRSKIEKKDKK